MMITTTNTIINGFFCFMFYNGCIYVYNDKNDSRKPVISKVKVKFMVSFLSVCMLSLSLMYLVLYIIYVRRLLFIIIIIYCWFCRLYGNLCIYCYVMFNFWRQQIMNVSGFFSDDVRLTFTGSCYEFIKLGQRWNIPYREKNLSLFWRKSSSSRSSNRNLI